VRLTTVAFVAFVAFVALVVVVATDEAFELASAVLLLSDPKNKSAIGSLATVASSTGSFDAASLLFAVDAATCVLFAVAFAVASAAALLVASESRAALLLLAVRFREFAVALEEPTDEAGEEDEEDEEEAAAAEEEAVFLAVLELAAS